MNILIFIDPSVSGLSWVAAISLFVILLDIFFETKILTVLSLLAISLYFSLFFDISIKWRISISILCWLGATAGYYLLADKFLVPAVRALFTKGFNEADATGKEGVYRVIEGKAFIHWNDELWRINAHDQNNFVDGQKILITSTANGKFTIK
jgi:hypothetical protein